MIPFFWLYVRSLILIATMSGVAVKCKTRCGCECASCMAWVSLLDNLVITRFILLRTISYNMTELTQEWLQGQCEPGGHQSYEHLFLFFFVWGKGGKCVMHQSYELQSRSRSLNVSTTGWCTNRGANRLSHCTRGMRTPASVRCYSACLVLSDTL